MRFINCEKCGLQNEYENISCVNCRSSLLEISEPAHMSASISRTGTGLKLSSDEVMLTTTESVPGRVVDTVIGLVFAAGNAAWTLEGTSKKSNTAMGKASFNLMLQAGQLGADAVIGIQMSIDGSGSAVNRSQTVSLIGTAVKLVSLSE